MRKLTENQKDFILQNFFKNESFAGWKNIANNLLLDDELSQDGEIEVFISPTFAMIKSFAMDNNILSD